MLQRETAVALATALLIAIGTVAQAQTDAARVGVIVRVDSPGIQLNEPEILDAILTQLDRGFEQFDRFTLVDQASLAEAQRSLGIHLGLRGKPDDLRRFARLLRLERVVVVQVTITDLRVGMATAVYSARGEQLGSGHFQVNAPQLDAALERALRVWLEQTLPLLS